MVFEDMEWADASLLDFIEYLVDWSKNHPLFVIVLARPELAERRPTWGAGKRAIHARSTWSRCPASDMDQLLAGLVPGLPDELRARIRERAEGVPLYAVETVRMLLDRGPARRAGAARTSRPGRSVRSRCPRRCTRSIAARLDGLARRRAPAASRTRRCSGRRSPLDALAKLDRARPDDLEPALAQLVRKEVLSLQADPLSPERGQYGFLQDLMRRVAYDMLSKHERQGAPSRGGRAGRGRRRGGRGRRRPLPRRARRRSRRRRRRRDQRAGPLRRCVRAGERAGVPGGDAGGAALLRAGGRARRRARRAGPACFEQRRHDGAATARARPMRSHTSSGRWRSSRTPARPIPGARVSARLGEVMWDTGRLREALERMDAALDLLSTEEPDADVAELAHQVGRFRFFAGDPDVAAERVEQALILAEALNLPDVLSQAVNTKAMLLSNRGRMVEAGALMRLALQIALDNDLPSAAIRAYNNAADFDARGDRYEQAAQGFRDGLALARRVGLRQSEWQFLGQVYPLYALGRWDEALDLASGVPDEAFVQSTVSVHVPPRTGGRDPHPSRRPRGGSSADRRFTPRSRAPTT